MIIRKAKPEEAAHLTKIALDAKRHWGYPEHWISHWESDLTITEEFISSNHVYVAEDNKELDGFYALRVDGKRANLEHLWVSPQYIGTSVGKELFLDAMERLASLSSGKIG